MDRYLFSIAATLLSAILLFGILNLAASPALADSCSRAPTPTGPGAAAAAPQQPPLHRCPNFATSTTFEKQGILPPAYDDDETLARIFVLKQFNAACNGLAELRSVTFLPDANTPQYFIAQGSCL
jgi:hypothetical protein